MPAKRGHEPRLTAHDRIFRSGYGPRAIRLSLDRSALFVGCKDGSVAMIDLAAAADAATLPEARSRLCGAGPTGVRSLCDLDNGWLLLGRDDGTLATLPWTQEARAGRVHDPSPVPLPERPKDGGTFGYVGRWEGETFIVAQRHADAFLLRLEGAPDGKDFALVLGETLPETVGVSGFARLGEKERWLVGKTGSLWWQGPTGLERQDDLWDESGFERPGFVFDMAVVRRHPDRWPDYGIYLSTDEGVFLLRRPSPEAQPGKTGWPPRFSIEPVYLPGITETCMAITHAVQGDCCYLWVSDVEGSVHLFWSDVKFWEPEGQGQSSRWKRSGLLERRFPVMRAIASWAPEKPHEAVVAQACRDDRIVVSWYVSEIPGLAARREVAAELLSWGRARDLLGPDDQRRSWTLEALVADHIEETGRDAEGLRRFLRNPGTELAVSALSEILGKGSRRRAGAALTLWTHTLIGTVHRRLDNPTTQDYFGIIRWLRRIGESVRQYPEWADDPLRSIDRNIQYARKWGVFGKTYADRQSALSALEPLQRQKESEERKFDALVYESLLFRRRVDPVETLPDPTRHAFAPWDLRHLPLKAEDGEESTEYVAVSWTDGGTVYRRRKGEEWKDLTAEEWKDLTAEERKDLADKYGSTPERAPQLGGRILLGTCGSGEERRPFLLSSPVREEDPRLHKRAEIQLRFLETPGGLHGEPASRVDVQDLLAEEDRGDRPEAVFCLYNIGNSHVAVGLEGISGSARIGLLRVTSTGLEPLAGAALPPNHPESKTLLRNPVWAFSSYGSPKTGVVLFVGCGDGQIWQLQLRFSESKFEIERRSPVGRLGAPVSALACSGPSQNGPSRVFAGATDGTLVAFQAIWDRLTKQEIYTTLWATQEEGPVRSLHSHWSPLVGHPEGPGREDADAWQVILAVMQPGRVVLLLDLPKAESTAKHPRVPGERLGRFSLRSTAFGSVLLPATGEEGHPALARLLVACAAGGPRLLTLHDPKLTRLRREEFLDLQRRWLDSLRGPDGQIQKHLLRRPETTHAAAPYLPAVLVRWILPFDPHAKSWEDRMRDAWPDDTEGLAQQWLPRHLRPLVDLDTAWKQGKPLNGLLRSALLAAREVDDKTLFKEILEAALSRANHQIQEEARSGNGLPFAERFETLLADLEKVKGVWEGSSGRLDSRMRITIAKNLLDGDTLWSLAQVQPDGDPATKEGPAEVALAAFIGQIHRALGKGDLLLSLETLHAANLALLRICRQLRRQPEQDWKQARPGQQFVSWYALRGFFQAVGDFAARVAHPKGNLGEVAAHEICRAYALGMIACPPAMIQLSMWVAEADLPPDTSRRVVHQLDLLETLLDGQPLPLSARFRELLEISFGLHLGESHKNALFFRPKGEELRWITEPREIGQGNIKMAEQRKPFDDIVVWLHDVARQLTDDAGDVELRKYEEMLGGIAKNPSEKDQHRHSRHFWRDALKDLEAKCRSRPHLFARPDEAAEPAVRPELVLFSSDLQSWCRKHLDILQNLRGEYQIFEPASTLYDGALALVERAARRFRQGAAVQKNLVLGVLGHGLLELLDEHLLEVWEVAQALDPRRTWEEEQLEGKDGYFQPQRTRRPATTTAARFAVYLLQRAVKAEAIPKNLRSLQGLLSFTDKDRAPQFTGKDEALQFTLRNLFEDDEKDDGDGEKSWDVRLDEIPEESLDQRTYHFLHLILNELLQNDRMHGVPGRSDKPVVRVDSSSEELALRFEFRYPDTDQEAVSRAWKLYEHHLQTMMPPREEPRRPSHGTGLYLANLAAGAVGWKLEPEEPKDKGVLCFRLTRIELFRKEKEER